MANLSADCTKQQDKEDSGLEVPGRVKSVESALEEEVLAESET
jgi:hypothetical protein